MNERFTEDSYEQTLIDLLKREGYDYEYGPAKERDHKEPVDKEELYKILYSVNAVRVGALLSGEYDDVINEAVQKVTSINEGTLEQRNERFMDYLQHGVEVSFTISGRQETTIIKLVDYENPLKRVH